MGLLDRFKGRRGSEEEEAQEKLEDSERLTEELARRVLYLEAQLAVFDVVKKRGQHAR